MTDALDYIPHSGKMALIDAIYDNGDDWIECLVDPKKSLLFVDHQNRTPSWLGIEYMAQTIAAHAGWNAKLQGSAVKPGLLLSTRHYQCTEKYFTGSLIVKAELLFQNDKLASYKCSIRPESESQILVSSTINIFQPDNFSQAIQGITNE